MFVLRNKKPQIINKFCYCLYTIIDFHFKISLINRSGIHII